MKKLLLISLIILLSGCLYEIEGPLPVVDEPPISQEDNDESKVNSNQNQNNDVANNDDQNIKNENESFYLALPTSVQETSYYCAPAALQSVLAYHGIEKSQDELAIMLHTSSITGTEYADLAKVATQLIFPDGDGLYQSVIPSNTLEERSLFEERLLVDLKNNDPVFVSVDNYIMYQDCPSAVHQIVINGAMIENGIITTIYYLDPSYTRQDETYGALKKCNMDELWNAMIQNKEPGYVY